MYRIHPTISQLRKIQSSYLFNAQTFKLANTKKCRQKPLAASQPHVELTSCHSIFTHTVQ